MRMLSEYCPTQNVSCSLASYQNEWMHVTSQKRFVVVVVVRFHFYPFLFIFTWLHNNIESEKCMNFIRIGKKTKRKRIATNGKYEEKQNTKRSAFRPWLFHLLFSVIVGVNTRIIVFFFTWWKADQVLGNKIDFHSGLLCIFIWMPGCYNCYIQ